MKRRTAILTALALLVASGAWAGDKSFIVKVPFIVHQADTADFLDESGTAMNDTAIYYTESFGVTKDFSHIIGHVVQTVTDSATATGFAADSVAFRLQAKVGHDSATTWWPVWAKNIMPVASFDSASGWARGIGTRIDVPSDSIPSAFDQWRGVLYYVTPRDSFISAAALGYSTWGDSTTFEPYAELMLYLIFKETGEQ